MSVTHRCRPRPARTAALLLALTLVALALTAPTAHAAVTGQAASGTKVAKFIQTEWWPQARSSVAGSDVGYETLPLKRVRCPRTVTATASTDSQAVLAAALADLAAGDVAPTIDSDTGVFTCVALLDRQPLLIGGAINEAGEAHFATASLILSPTVLAGSVADEFAAQVGGTADVTCSTRSVIVVQPDTPLRCAVVADDGTKGLARVVLDGSAAIQSVDFARK